MRSLLFVLLLACLTAIAPAASGKAFETVFADNGARYLRGDLLKGSDGNFYGTTEYGGTSNLGTVFKLTPSGVQTTLASFDYTKGSKPNTRLVEGNDGNFYGTTYYGGESNYGTVFKVTPAGVLSTVAVFNGLNGCYPAEGLIKGRDGNFYGTTNKGSKSYQEYYYPTVFRVTPAGLITTISRFDEAPTGLVEGSDGSFYVMTYYGQAPYQYQSGTLGRGRIYKIPATGFITTLVAFDWFSTSIGSNPYGKLVEGSDGTFYGTTANGGLYGKGTFFKMTPGGQLTALLSFDPANGIYPCTNLIKGSDDCLYGTTSVGGPSGDGTVVKVTPTGEITTIATFDSTNGSTPDRALAEGSDGSFYGITRKGGTSGAGTFFKVTPAGAVSTIASLKPTNGIGPSGKLLKGSDGNFYGMTSAGGANNLGTVFKVTPAGELTTLVTFNKANGSLPTGGLVEGSDGNFYGTTREGGANNYGTVFKVTPAGELTTLVSFNFTNGRTPDASLIEGSDGNFYGTSSGGGPSNYGTVFKVTPAGGFTTLAFFNGANGIEPSAALIEGSDGNFYGTTWAGGATGSYGTIFKVTPSGELTTLVSFSNPSNGQYLAAELVKGNDGSFYGTTHYGGASNYGTVFKVAPTGELTTLASFNGIDGRYPSTALVAGSNGNFYGTASLGGADGYGTIYKVTPSGVLTALYSFDGVTAQYPDTPLFDADGKLYGTADQMVIWRFSLNAPPEVSVSVPSAVTPTGATLAGTVNANGTDTAVTFEYGLTPAYGSSVAAIPGTVPGWGPTAVSATLSGLAPHTTYYYRITAVSSNGATSTLGASFTTANQLPVAANDSYSPNPNLPGAISLAVLANDSDADGDTLTITGVTQGAFGAVTTDGATLTYTPGPGFLGRDSFSYTVSDGIDEVTAQVEIRATSPFVRGLSSSAITATGATLSGTVNANGADTTVTFEYGLTPAYGSSVVASPNPVIGTSGTAVSAILSGLAPRTTYYYRLTASNANGPTSTAGASFTTANQVPVATNDSFAPATNAFGPMTLAVLANDSDADGDSLIITGVTQGSFGTVTTDGTIVTYTPRLSFLGRDSFSYTVSDGINAVSAQVELRATSPFPRALFSKGSEVPGAGQPGSGIPAGALFKSFGVPSINSTGKLAFTASYGTSKSPSELSVIVLDPKAVTSTLAARKGQIAPGTNGALFSSLKDPLLNETGDVAFLATLSGGDTTKQNKDGLWICPSSATNSAGTQLVARSGAQPPGAPTGARWKSFTSVAFAGVGESNTSWSLAFTAFMAPGAGGVSTANDMGLWIASPSKTVLALREGQTLQIGGTEKKLRSFAALMPLANALGQGNGVTSEGGVAVQAFFTDGSQAMLRVSGPGENENVIIEALALPGDAVADTAETAAKFGIPTQSTSGTATAWLGSLNGKSNPAAIFERNLSEPELLKLLARKGEAAPGIEGASFSTFRSVAVNDSGDILFLGKVSGRGISSNNDEGLWWMQSFGFSDSDAHGYFLRLLAREGSQPPGVPEGARWSSFTSLALSEGPYGPLFTAKLVGGAKGKGPGKITSANDQGLWAVDSRGELQLVVQEGQELIVEGSSTPKTLKSFTVLSAVPGSPTQRRSFAGDGQIVYRALFTDGSQAIVKVQLP